MPFILKMTILFSLNLLPIPFKSAVTNIIHISSGILSGERTSLLARLCSQRPTQCFVKSYGVVATYCTRHCTYAAYLLPAGGVRTHSIKIYVAKEIRGPINNRFTCDKRNQHTKKSSTGTYVEAIFLLLLLFQNLVFDTIAFIATNWNI
jgi:hypothetical protein